MSNNLDIIPMRLKRYFTTLLFAIVAVVAALAEEVIVTVTPLRPILPPQVMLYISNPGQYFSLSVQNTTDEVQAIYFGAEIRQLTPAPDIEIIVPGKTMPRVPVEVPAGGSKMMTAAEMRTMFNHVQMGDVVMPQGIFESATSNSFGNLPEGDYEIIISAYKWDPSLKSPVLISNPTMSKALFKVCYQGNAPQWTMPVDMGDFENGIASLSQQTPLMMWMAPVVNCSSMAHTFTYDLKIVQLMPLQAPEEAIERNPVVYQAPSLTMPQCMIPLTVFNNLSPLETYVAQITAYSNATQVGSLDYIELLNNGKSELRLFKIKDFSGHENEITKYSVPQLVSPVRAGGVSKFATLDPSMPVVEWTEPVRTGFMGRSVAFSYTIRIVEPTPEYDNTPDGIRRALDELKPVFEVDGVRHLKYNLPDETVKKFDPSQKYLLEVIARPDTTYGAYEQFEFADEGRSLPSIFACQTAFVSAPRFEVPKPFSQIDYYDGMDLNKVAERIYKDNATIKWTEPKVQGDLEPSLEFVYDLKIVKPTGDYGITKESMSQALDELDAEYEKTGITASNFTLPESVFSTLESTHAYLMRVTARISGNSAKLGQVAIANDGKSEAAIVAFSQSAEPTTYGTAEFISPKPCTELFNERTAFMSINNPKFTWNEPEMTGEKAETVKFTYNLKIVSPSDAEDEGEYEPTLDGAKKAIAELESLHEVSISKSTSYTLPDSILKTMRKGAIYVARLRAVPDTTSVGKDYKYKNYGFSIPTLFALTDSDVEDLSDGSVIYDDSVYNFTTPEIISPRYDPDDGARKEFLGNDIEVEWRKPEYLGGGGVEPDTIQFAYDIELYSNKEYISRKEMLEKEPIFSIKDVKSFADTIRWDKIESLVNKGDYMMLRIKPKAVNDTTVVFVGDSLNVIDFGMSELFTHRYFQCANQVDITNETPTSRTVDDLKGKSIRIGEYELVLDGELTAIDGKPGHFKGNGHVIWEPLLLTWKLAVKFDDIAVNTDDRVFEGNVETWGGPENKMPSSEVVDKLFSDWGIDNIIGDTGLPYADKLQAMADGKVKGLAESLDIAQYYQDFNDGKAKVLGLLSGNVENVTFPLEIPEDINPTPVNLTISKMKFAPTHATMDLFGTFVVPETKATENQILVFGSPRMCISPKSLIPEGGTVALLKDFEVLEPTSGFKCKFKAPEDVMEPNNGCFVSWSNNKFEWLNLDIDMTMPDDLKKVDDNGKRTEENPKLHVTTQIQLWEDFIATASMDPFEHVDLPGYVFTAQDVVVDLASRKNHQDMAKFPEGYDLAKSGLNKEVLGEWEGLYIKELSMQFPSSIKLGNGSERMKVALTNAFIDKSGFTADCGIVNAINYSTGDEGTIGGFKFSLDNIYVSVIQNNFNKFGFDGKLAVPLFDGKIDYSCSIYNQTFTKKGTGKGYAYVFKTSQIEDLNFDFMLGDLTLTKELTYFLVEALPDEQGELKTNVELCVGGEVTIAGTEMVNKKAANLPFDLKLPKIKFCKMRIANNKSFESVYELEMQETSLKAIEEMLAQYNDSNALFSGKWNEEEDMQLGEDCWLNFGQWGAASPAKGIGPFKFALTDWGFDINKNGNSAELGIKLGGDITFCDELSITAGTTLEFVSTLQNIDDLSNISIGFKEVKFHEARFGMENAAFKFNGVLAIDGEGGSAGGTDKGYKGLIDLSIAGGLFELKVQGGYYEHKEEENNFSWGFFDVQAGGKCGLPIPPITLDNIHGGVYFNCQYNKENPFAPKPKQGAIGIIFGMGISTIDKVTLSGNLELTVAYNYKIKKLTTFIFSGGVKAVGGVVNSKVKLVYEDNDAERYFQLNVSVDASLDGGLNDLIGEWASSLEGDYMDPETGFQGAMKDESSERGKGSDYEANMDKFEKKKKADTEKSEGVSAQGPGLKIQLDIRVGHKKTVTEGPDGTKVVTNGPNKWHVYLGEPEKSKRCQFVLVDFKSKIVSVSVGADAYFCLGNELPGDGELPPIPEKISKFLNGGSTGGVDSDDIKAAENARKKAKDVFFKDGASEVSGGVMLGASVWGYISVDLGLFYGDLGAEAGFDISVRNLGSKVMCVNLPGGPGRNGWYGEGQLYAYLYAKFGLRINLGFFKKKIDLIDAGIGGVLQCGMPNPNYFTGKARVKIRLLGGLVNLNKRFSFECGDKCQFFYGNALDDYKIFEKCNIGVDTPEEALSNPIDWERQSFPEVETQPILGNVIRVVDPTEKARIEAEAQGKTESNTEEGEESFEEWSSRSFKFIMTDVPELTEYTTESDFKNDRNGKPMEVEHGQSGTKLKVKLTRFNPNCYYRLRLKGCAKEYHQMKWQDPWTFDTISKKYSHTPWVQTKDFYFVTNNKERTFADDEDLQPHVAVAIPAFGVRLCSKNEKGDLYSVNATMDDAQMPSISLFEPMKGKAYNKGTLKWYVWRDGQLQGTRNVAWFENDSVSVIMPSSKLPGMVYEKTSRVRLRYEWQEQVKSDATWVPINTYTVQGSSREEIQKKYAKDLLARYGSRASKYRVVVQQANYLNDETDETDLPTSSSTSTGTATLGKNLSSSKSSTGISLRNNPATSNTFGTQNNNLTFTVTIMQFKSGLVTVTHVKDLYEMDITPTYKDWTAEQLFAETSRPPLWQTLAGRKLNSLTSGSDHEWVDEDNTYLNALNAKTTKLPWTSYNNNRNERLVTQNPFFYLTYLAKAFFIGGVHWKPGYLEHVDISTRSLEITSPYGKWTNGILDHMLGNGYQEIRDMAVFSSKMAYGRYSSPYPLYTKNSSDDSEFPFKQNGFVTAHQLTEKEYALIQDLQQEFVLVRKAVAELNNQSEDKAVSDYVGNLINVVDAVFARVGYDISHYDNLEEFKEVVLQIITEVEQLGGDVHQTIQDFEKDKNLDGDEVASMLDKVVPRVISIVRLVKTVSDIEFDKIADELQDASVSAGQSIKEQFLNKEFARKVLDHILITLLKNAKEVFKDEIEFVKMTVEQHITVLKDDVQDITRAISEQVQDTLQGINVNEIEDVLQETLSDAKKLYSQVDNELRSSVAKAIGEASDKLNVEYSNTFKKISHGLSVTYSILDFLGILKEKQITLQLPENLKNIIQQAQNAIQIAENKVTQTVEDITQNTQEAIGAVERTLNMTQQITGMGVAALSTTGIQITTLDCFYSQGNDALQRLSDGFESVGVRIGDAATEVSSTLQGGLEAIRNFSYPIKLTVLNWKEVECLFTNPVKHFKKLYPINSMDDAQNLMKRIMDILHNINPDIPDFNSLKQLLEDLLKKLQAKLLKLINELKEKSIELAKEVWGKFQPLITTIRKVIDMLKEMALALKEKMSDILDDVKDAVKDVAKVVKTQLEDIGNELSSQIKSAATELKDAQSAIKGNVENILTQIDNDINEVSNTIKKGLEQASDAIEDVVEDTSDAITDAVGDVSDAITDAVGDASDAINDALKQIKAPSFNLPKAIKNALTEPLTDAVSETFKNSGFEVDWTPFIELAQQHNEFVAAIKRLKRDANKLQVVMPGLSLNVDLPSLDEAFGNQFPNVFDIVEEEAIQPLQLWAYGVLQSVKTVTDVDIWESRLNNLLTQVKAEFQNDLGNITGLISKEGAMKLFNDSAAVGEQLKKNININDYITIVQTAVDDVVLPNPEYFYTSFKSCLQNIFSNFISRLVKEYDNLKSKATNALATTINSFKSSFDDFVKKIKGVGGNLSEQAKKILASVENTIEELKALIGKIEEALVAVKGLPSDIFGQLKDRAKDFFKNLATNFVENLEELVSDIWRNIKNQVIMPLINYIKENILLKIKEIFRKVLRKVVESITEIKEDINDTANSLLDKFPVIADLQKALREFIDAIKTIIGKNQQLEQQVQQLFPEGKITSLKQLPDILSVIAQDETVEQEFQNLKLSLKCSNSSTTVEIPYYYVNMAQDMVCATLDFVQSDMSVKEIIKLVVAMYKGIPEEVKDKVIDLLPEMPKLPDNAFTELLGDVSCSYDLDNRMCNVTLLNLKNDKEEQQGNNNTDLDYSLALQLFMFVGVYNQSAQTQFDALDEASSEAVAVAEDVEVGDEDLEEEGVPAIYMMVHLRGNLKVIFNIGENHFFNIELEGNVGDIVGENKEVSDKSLGFCLTQKEPEKGVTSVFHGFGSLKSLAGIFMAKFSRNNGVDTKQKAEAAQLLATKYLDIKVGNYPQTLYLLYNNKLPEDILSALNLKDDEAFVEGFTAGYLAKLEDVEFVLKLRHNDFFAKVLKDDISAQFSVSLLYDYLKGFKLGGGYSFHLDLDCSNLQLGSVNLQTLGIDLGSLKNNWGTLNLGVGSTFSVDFSAVKFSFENLGLGINLNVIKPDFSIGDWDFGFKFKFPEGIGIAIDTSALKGAGLISYKEETGELFGTLELDVIDKFGLSALLMSDLGVVEGHSFNLAAFMSASFSPGIPLGMGFSLTAIGGALGLQRMLDRKAITQSVRQGTLDSVFFVDNVASHLAEMKLACESIFPAKEKQFFFGLLGQISYEPVVKCNFGLMLQMPDPVEVIIVGALKVGIKDSDVIRINVYFAGGVNFTEGIWFDASIVDSQIVGIKLEGDMAFRLFWGGQTKGFLLSIGGFHPNYKPEEGMMVADMKRMAMKLDYKILKIGLDAYLAVTSNSFQIGAHLDLKIGWNKFGITGYAGFDALFQFDPFMFMLAIEAGVSVVCGSWKLLSIDLSLSLSGPAPWNAKGNAKFWFLFVPVKIGFNITWGDSTPKLPEKQIEILPLLEKELANPSNWISGEASRKDSDIFVRKYDSESALLLSPFGTFSFNQSIVPLEDDKNLDLCNNAVPADYNRISIKYIVAEDVRVDIDAQNYEHNDFAPALYYLMSNTEKLSSPSYKSFKSGFKSSSKQERDSGTCQTINIEVNEVTIGNYRTSVETQKTSTTAKVNANPLTDTKMAYQNKNKAGFDRYVELLDKLK